MTQYIPHDQFVSIIDRPLVRPVAQAAVSPAITPAAQAHRGEYGRAFDLHPALFAMTVAAYLGYLAIMALAFMDAELILPMVIFVLFVCAGFGTPALWARVAPPPAGNAPSWSRFMRDGFVCMTGHVSARGAMCQVLIMPVLVLLWGVAIAIIAACVT